MTETTNEFAAGLSYSQVGWTALGWWPPGFHSIRRFEVVGSGRDTFDQLGAVIAHWGILAGAGLRVDADNDVALPGSEVRSRLTLGSLLGVDEPENGLAKAALGVGAVAPCRVVWAGDEISPRDGRHPVASTGFGYGTLPGHPERGEEAFIAHLFDNDDVEFEIRVFSTPSSFVYKLGSPVLSRIQAIITDRYFEAAAAVVR